MKKKYIDFTNWENLNCLMNKANEFDTILEQTEKNGGKLLISIYSNSIVVDVIQDFRRVCQKIYYKSGIVTEEYFK